MTNGNENKSAASGLAAPAGSPPDGNGQRTDQDHEDLTTAYMLGRHDGRKDAERGQALSASPGSVYELVDCTDDETYFPMGLFLSLEDALAQIKDRAEPPTDDPEEFIRMEVRERQIGRLRWWDNGETVAKIEWVEDYIESKDEWVWHAPTISFPNTEQTDTE